MSRIGRLTAPLLLCLALCFSPRTTAALNVLDEPEAGSWPHNAIRNQHSQPTAVNPQSGPQDRSVTSISCELNGCAPEGADDRLFWSSIINSKDPADFDAYLAQFPTGLFRALADNRLAILRASTASHAAAAQSNRAPAEVPRTRVSFYTENDDWPPDTGADKNYTNGWRLTVDFNSDVMGLHRLGLFRGENYPRPCSVTGRLGDEVCISTAFHVGQQFYTPADIETPLLQPYDRPYAGWLYGGVTTTAASINTAAITDLYLGATGPASLADRVQTKWHEWVDARTPRGWDHQIGNRFGVTLGHSRHWAWDKIANNNRWFEFSSFVGGDLGNIMTDVYAGARAKIGYHITRDWTRSAINPVVGGESIARSGQCEAFLSFEGRGRLVGYNAFLDAADQHRLTRKTPVTDGGIAVGIRMGRVMVTYRLSWISREFAEVPTHHEYKAIRVRLLVG